MSELFPLATALQSTASDIARLLIELSEVEIAEHDARMAGVANSQESGVTARGIDGDLNAWQTRNERTRVRARLDAARITYDTIVVLLGLGFTDWPSP